MRSYKKVVFSLLVALLATATITVIAALQGQNQSKQKPTSEQDIAASETPIADYAAPEPTDVRVRTLRKNRGRRYDNHDPSINSININRFTLTETSKSFSWAGVPSNAPIEPAFPVSQSDAIVIGEVLDAQAHLSNDKTDIYSEFSVRVDQVLKDDSPVSLSPGASIVTERAGGAVRFPSGKIVQRTSDIKPLPRSGRRYVFFLKHNQEGEDFSILTGYELRDGRVFPLDGLHKNGSTEHQLAAYQNYRETDEASLLSNIHEAIMHPELNMPVQGALR